MGQLTVNSDFDFPHIGGCDIIQGAAFILPRLVTFDIRDFQVFILTHKALASWGWGKKQTGSNHDTVKAETELYSQPELVEEEM